MIDVWSSPEVLEILVALSDSTFYQRVRNLFDTPLRICPEHLLLTLSQIKVDKGTFLIDELLTILMGMFLGNH